MVTFASCFCSRQLDESWSHLGRVSVRGYSQWVSLWGLCSVNLRGSPIPLWVAPFPRLGVLNCVRVEKLSWAWTSEHGPILFSSLMVAGVMWLWLAIWSSCLNFTTLIDLSNHHLLSAGIHYVNVKIIKGYEDLCQFSRLIKTSGCEKDIQVLGLTLY